MHPMKLECGFTWLEILAVLAVVGILALMAVPSLQETALRKQVKDALAIAEVAKAGVQAGYMLGGELPADTKAAGVPSPEKIVGTLVSGVTVKDGAITLELGNSIHKSLAGKHVTIRPAVVPDEPRTPIAWLCHNMETPKGMEPRGRDDTDVPNEWLPLECRGTAK